MSARPEFIVVNCISNGYAVAVTSDEEGVAFELVHWGLLKADAIRKAEAGNEPTEIKHVKD